LSELQEAAARKFEESLEYEIRQKNTGKIVLRGLFGVEFRARRGGVRRYGVRVKKEAATRRKEVNRLVDLMKLKVGVYRFHRVGLAEND